jgi:hypothetical protein
MKKSILFVALCCIAMFFVACEKDGPQDNKQEDSVDNNRTTIDGVTVSGTIAGHDYVDLGLGVKWATYNIGATKPEGYGDYYAWGDTATQTTYNWSNYKYANGCYDALTKYCNDSKYGKDDFTDTLTTLEVADDAATQIWGGNWRMPTDDEWQELVDSCTWTWITQNGVNGFEVKATNGRSIFLPAAGCRDDVDLYGVGSNGRYWSSSLHTYYPYGARAMFFSSSDHGMVGSYRNYGTPVRAVVAE